MGNGRKLWLGAFMVALVGVTPSVVPVGGSVMPASASDCSPASTTFVGDGSFGTDGVDYRALVFTATGACDWTVPVGVTEIDLLVIAGGGAGGSAAWGGGGGAGELVEYSGFSTTPGANLSVSVGAGGSTGSTDITVTRAGAGLSTSGSDSSISDGSSTVTADGGGRGGTYGFANGQTEPIEGSKGGAGGSGGGSSEAGNAGAPGGSSTSSTSGNRTGYGNPGGASQQGGSFAGAGGGGSGDAGADVTGDGGNRDGGDGGAGTFEVGGWLSSITSLMGGVWVTATTEGANRLIAAGGGGGSNTAAPGAGGSGGGGSGGHPDEINGGAGTPNTGSGGGGASYAGSGGEGGAGGSGLVIVRYSFSTGEILRLDATHPEYDDQTGAGKEWNDQAGSLDADAQGDPTYNARTKAFEFDGTDDYFDLPDIAVDFSNGLAIHAVVDFGEAENYERVLEFTDSNGTAGNIAFGRYSTDNTLYFEVYQGSSASNCYSRNDAIREGFHSYSVILSSEGVCTFQRDGVTLSANQDSDAFIPDTVLRNTNYIGVARGGSSQFFDGSIQSVVMYNTAQVTPTCYPVEDSFTGDGTIGEDDVSYKTLQFTTAGDCQWDVPAGISLVDYLVVAGGGGGGHDEGGGGGAGGFRTGTDFSVTAGATVALSVGVGGAGAPDDTSQYGSVTTASSGQDSGFSTVISSGGGAGGDAINNASGGRNGLTGGSGGGGAGEGYTTDGGLGNAGAYAPSEGHDGASQTSQSIGGGGGGAGSGGSGSTGGQGASSTLTGTTVTYAAGGGGGYGNSSTSSAGEPGDASAGRGGDENDAPGVGEANSGSGGGGGGGDAGTNVGNVYAGGDGGSGVVVLRYSLGPGAPAISSVSSGDGSIDVAFTAPSHTGGAAITDYEYSFDGSTWTSLGTVSAGTETISGRTNGTAYTVRLRAVNDNGKGESVTGSSSTPRASQTMTWSPGPTWVNTNIDTSVTLSPPPTVLGGVNVTYEVTSTTGDASCTISNASTPTVSSISGSGTCVITATSAEDIYEEATATLTLTVFAGAGSGNACDQNVSGSATVATYEFGADCLVVFSAASSASWITPDSVSAGSLLLIAGGGGGGTYGGGGAGELFEDTSFSFNSSPYTVAVGGGGTGSQGTNSEANDGSDSVFGALTANGGGAGGSLLSSADDDGSPARDGGSGGGGRTQGINKPQSGGSSVLTAGGVGFAGGDGNKTAAGTRIAGGGGGAGGPGGDADTSAATAGDGGIGAAVSILSVSESNQVNLGEVDDEVVRFAGGGGGNRNGAGFPGSGGLGGGGDAFVVGLPNSGGGGGGSSSTSWAGRAGGSGVVILRYTRAAQSALAVTSSASSVAFGSAVTLSVSGGSGAGEETLALTSGDCTLSGSTLTATGGAGNCVVTATKAADSSYLASTATVTVGLTKVAQSALSITVDDNTLDYLETATLSSSGGSGVGAVTFSVDSGDCSVSGTTVTATGGTTDCVMSALKAADDDYLEASSSNTVTISISKAAQTITFGALTGKSYGVADFSVSSTSSSGLSVSFTSNDTDICTMSGSTVSIVAAGTCSVTANQGGNSFYSSATGVTQTFSVSAKAITVSVVVADKVYDAGTTATVSSGVLSGVVSGDTVSFVAANAAAAFGTAAVASGKSVTVTLDGDELSGADAGNYSLTVSGSPSASVTAKPITVNVTPAGKTYDGTQSVSSFTTSLSGAESGDTVSVDSGEVSVLFDAPGAGTQTATATVTSSVLTGADAGNYSASVGTVSSAVIAKASQASLSFSSASSVVFGQTLTLVVTGGSGSGAITYGASGDCSLSSGVITPTGAGSCSVTATRAADSNYLASSAASQTVTVSKANQSINFTSTVPVSAVSGTSYTPTATASSALTVAFDIAAPGKDSVCSISGSTVTFLSSGTCVIMASQAGDTDYNAASSVTQTIVAGEINQTISFPAIAGKDFDDLAFSAGASVSSGRTVTYATSTGSVCAVTSSTGVISIKTVGECTVTASSAGDASYAAASDVSRTFTIGPVLAGKPSITSVSFGDSSVTVAFVAPGFVGGDAIDGYQVVATSTGGFVTKPDCATSSPCTITGLTNGTSYTLTVAAVNAAGVGPVSAASPSITPARVADAVSGLATTPGDEVLAVTWTALTNDQVTAAGGTFTRYDVYLRVNGGSWGSAVTPDGTNNLATRTTTSYTFTGLTNGTAYDVKVVAITNANSTELSSNTSTALGVPATTPAAVSGLTATALSNTTALASWSAPLDDGGAAVTAYSVSLSCTFVNATDTFCELSGLTAGSTVTVTVGATNLMGTGSSVSVSVTMPGGSSGRSGGGSPGSQAVVAATDVPVVAPRRVIVPVQPTPLPRLLAAPVRIIPERGFDPTAGAKARVGGQPATVTKKPLGDGGLSVEVGAFQLGIKLSTPGSSELSGAGQRSDIDVPTGQSTKVSGGGLLPGSSLQVWLPGMTGESPRELARIAVQSDGSFASELSFTSRQSETPIPIGPQVMQVTGYDEQGNQTIVDMVVNIGQGAPAPEPNRSVNELPDLSPGQSLATSAGTPEMVRVEATPQTGEVAVLSEEWAFTVTVAEDSGGVERVDSGATITMVQTKTASVSGEGFQPETRVDIWLFSDPTLLGSVIVAADGSFTGEVYVDARYATPGEHTLQLQGVAEDGFIKAANLGVLVQEPVELTAGSATGLLWWVAYGLVAVLLLIVLFFAVRRRSRRSAN